MTLGRQARGHIDEARRWLDNARAATEKSRASCKVSYPNLLKAHDALGQAWAHIEAINIPRAGVKKKRLDVIERARREKTALYDQHERVKRDVARASAAFVGRCVIK